MIDTLITLFNVNTIMFTIMGYSMSYLEFFGTIANILCVYLAAKNKILTWPIGLIGIILYLFLFYQIQLYSDFFEQIYFFFASFYGWILWSNIRPKKHNPYKPHTIIKIKKNDTTLSGFTGVFKKRRNTVISWGSLNSNIIWIMITLIGTGLAYIFMSNIHMIMPKLFPLPADYPMMDAFTTIMSFVATILMAQRKISCWIYWIIVDVIGIWLYWSKGVKFISLEYVLFLGNAIYGLWLWMSTYKNIDKEKL